MKTITFRPTIESARYGDNLTFFEYRIDMLVGARRVGTEKGPRRNTATRKLAQLAAFERIAQLQKHRLFAVSVTRKHISDGDARNCTTCAIAQALWHKQETMGFPRYDFSFEVSPYACWRNPRGLVLHNKREDSEFSIPADKLPELVLCGGKYSESMAEWAMQFDDWAESRFMSLADWREEHGNKDDERPYRPSPCSFVLDLDAMTELQK